MSSSELVFMCACVGILLSDFFSWPPKQTSLSSYQVTELLIALKNGCSLDLHADRVMIYKHSAESHVGVGGGDNSEGTGTDLRSKIGRTFNVSTHLKNLGRSELLHFLNFSVEM